MQSKLVAAEEEAQVQRHSGLGEEAFATLTRFAGEEAFPPPR